MAVARDVYKKDSDRSTTQCDLNCDHLEVRVYLDRLVVESFIDIDRNSTTRQLVKISSQWLKIAVIIGTSIVTQGWGMLQFGFLQAYNIWLMLMNQDIKVPSIASQTPNVPLQYSSHYDLFGLVDIFLFFRSPAGFVIGDVTGALFAPLLFSSTFFFGVGSWWALPTEVVFWTPSTNVSWWAHPTKGFSEVWGPGGPSTSEGVWDCPTDVSRKWILFSSPWIWVMRAAFITLSSLIVLWSCLYSSLSWTLRSSRSACSTAATLAHVLPWSDVLLCCSSTSFQPNTLDTPGLRLCRVQSSWNNAASPVCCSLYNCGQRTHRLNTHLP